MRRDYASTGAPGDEPTLQFRPSKIALHDGDNETNATRPRTNGIEFTASDVDGVEVGEARRFRCPPMARGESAAHEHQDAVKRG